MKLNSIFKLDIICLLFSTTTSIPLNENTNDVNSNSINDNNLLENTLDNEVSSSIWIDEDSINGITNSHLSNSYIPMTETFEIKPTTTATLLEPITKSTTESTISIVTSANETNNSEETISDNTQNENEIIPTKVSESIVLDETLPTNSITSTNLITKTETETEIVEEIELEEETEISEIESEVEVEIETIDSETELMESEIETETADSFIPIPKFGLPFSNKFFFNKYEPSDNDEIQTDTIDNENETYSLSPTDNNPNVEYVIEEEEEEDKDNNNDKHTISSNKFPYTSHNKKKYSNKNRFSNHNKDHSSDYSKDYFKNKKQNKNYKNNGKKGQFSNNKDFHIPKFKHIPYSRIKHNQNKKENKFSKTKTSTTHEEDNTTLRTKTTTTLKTTTKPSQTVELLKATSPVPSRPSATPIVSVLHDNVVNAVCWTLPNQPCCNSCNIYKPHNYTSSIVKYYGNENGDLCGISDLCIVDKNDGAHNKKKVIDSEGNKIQKKILLNSNQNIKKVKKSNEETIIKIPICWSNSIPCCENCTIVTSSNTNEHQYLGWENGNW